MAKVIISMSPGPDGSPGYSNITAEGAPSEVEAMIKSVDRLMEKYPVLKPKPESMDAKGKITAGLHQPR
jgi:hypothetical protein